MLQKELVKNCGSVPRTSRQSPAGGGAGPSLHAHPAPLTRPLPGRGSRQSRRYLRRSRVEAMGCSCPT
jgi:hypothetical protein